MVSDKAKVESTTAKTGNGDPSAGRMSFGDHLEELRSCAIRSLVGVVIGTAIALYFGKEILEIIYRPLLVVQHANGLSPNLQALSPTAAFTSYLKIGFLAGGLIFAMPWLLYQIWRFVSIGLYPKERRFLKWLMPTSIGLFALGVVFLYSIVLPIVLHFFISFNKTFGTPDLTPSLFHQALLPDPKPVTGLPSVDPTQVPVFIEDPKKPEPGQIWVNETTRRFVVQTNSGPLSVPLEVGNVASAVNSQFAIDFYISFVLMLALAFGIAFETPIVVFFLAWSGIVTRAAMKRGRRYVLLGTVAFAAVLTPPDVISQILLAGPMYLLFEVGILASWIVEEKSTATAAG